MLSILISDVLFAESVPLNLSALVVVVAPLKSTLIFADKSPVSSTSPSARSSILEFWVSSVVFPALLNPTLLTNAPVLEILSVPLTRLMFWLLTFLLAVMIFVSAAPPSGTEPRFSTPVVEVVTSLVSGSVVDIPDIVPRFFVPLRVIAPALRIFEEVFILEISKMLFIVILPVAVLVISPL